ncbi:zinc finger MYM-type protein 6-like [Aphis craccivora]|uniref:Zinc finger MYM-type protein 6-like n=1 Tax=Aphis craccivora TaxID=307492 RepID=A0A6G0ZC21_APHCR|nr:zinc finger MYM-type protein 6-like [Aphis craccivora]
MLNPIWAYEIQILDFIKISPTKTFQAFKLLSVHLLLHLDSWYISNNSIHDDLIIETVNTVAFDH